VAFNKRHFSRTSASGSTTTVDHVCAILSIPSVTQFDRLELPCPLRSLAHHGPGATLIFVDAPDFPGAYGIAGHYARSGEGVSVKVRLAGADGTAEEFEVRSQAKDLDGLVQRIVAEAERRIQRRPRPN
jgi:hypothetical protein